MKATAKDIDALVGIRRVIGYLRKETQESIDRMYPTGKDSDGLPITTSDWQFKYAVLTRAKRCMIKEITSSRIDRLIKCGKLESKPSDGHGDEIRVKE